MNKTAKILSISFFSLFAFAFFIVVVNLLSSFLTSIDSYVHYIDQLWSSLVSTILQLIVGVIIIIMSIKTILKVTKGEIASREKIVTTSLILFLMYTGTSLLSSIISLIFYCTNTSTNYSIGYQFVATLIFTLIATVLLVLSIVNTPKIKNKKLIIILAYAIFFVLLIASCPGVDALSMPFLVFLFFATFIGFALAVFSEYDFIKCPFKCKTCECESNCEKEEKMEEEDSLKNEE